MVRRMIFAAFLLSCFSFVFELQAQIVYENPNSGQPGLISDNPVGDEITLAGENRIITGIAIRIAQVDSGQGRASFHLTLYKNDGPEGEPNSVLWENRWYENYFIEGDEDAIYFSVPNIEVPETFTWILNITESWPQPTCYLFGDEPTVGSCKSYHWYHHELTDTWIKTYPSGDQPNNFSCQVSALDRGSIIPPGDFDKSHIIDLKDFIVLSDHWLEEDIYDANDIVSDHAINLYDLTVFLHFWLYDFRCVPCNQVCKTHLKAIGTYLSIYANDNKGKYPVSMQELIDYLISMDEADQANYLFCPCTDDPVGAISYGYRGSGLNDSVSAGTIIMYDKTGNHVDCPEYRNVLFGDGHIGAMSEEAFQAAIAADNLWRVGRDWPELPIE